MKMHPISLWRSLCTSKFLFKHSLCHLGNNRCDDVDIDGTTKPKSSKRGSYSHAEKIRAMATYAFSRVHHIGRVPWHEDPSTQKWYGNPSISETVSTYMCSLRRKKVSTLAFYYSDINLSMITQDREWRNSTEFPCC